MWIVGQVTKRGWDFKNNCWDINAEWEFNGVFDSEEFAVKACRDENYFVMPAELNVSLPHETVDVEGAYYPLEKKANG